MKQYVSDNTVCICLQGIRWVKKLDLDRPTYATEFAIEVQYKGSTLNVKFKERAERDKLYDQICSTLNPTPLPGRKEG